MHAMNYTQFEGHGVFAYHRESDRLQVLFLELSVGMRSERSAKRDPLT